MLWPSIFRPQIALTRARPGIFQRTIQTSLIARQNTKDLGEQFLQQKYTGTKVIDRELPKTRKVHYVALTIAVFALFSVAAYGMLNDGVTRSGELQSLMFSFRQSALAQQALGKPLQFKHSWPIIHGRFQPVYGIMDIHFSVKGSKDSGVLFFTAHRKQKDDWIVKRFELVLNDGQVLPLLDHTKPDIQK